MNEYTFFIDDGGGEIEVFPVISDLVFVDALDEENGIVSRVLETPMVFIGDSYGIIAPYEAAGCQELGFIVKFRGSIVFAGLLKVGTPNVQVNEVDCAITARIDNDTLLECFLNSWGEEFNMLSIATAKISVNTFIGEIETAECSTAGAVFMTLYTAGPPDDCLADPGDGWALLSWAILGVSGDFVSESVWVREVVTWPCDGATPEAPPGDGWLLSEDNCGATSDAVWARPPQLVPVSFEFDAGEEVYNQVNALPGGGNIEISNAVPISEIFESFMPCGLTVVSNFFNINPSGPSPANDEYASAAINLENVAIYQKSDVRIPGAAQGATIGLMSIQQLLLLLRHQFDARFRIIGTELRLEHSTYFEAADGLDLSAPPYAQIVAAHLRYGYDDSRLARAERWAFTENTSRAFAGRPIRYESCVPSGSQDEITYPLDKVNNDIGFITANPDLVSDDGFVFVNAIENGGNYYFSSEQVIGGPAGISLNGHMSIPNLQDRYHRNNRLLINGVMNGSPVAFNSAIPRKTQEEFVIILSRATYHSSFSPYDKITTVMGVGIVQSARYNGADCSLTLTLKY